MRRRISHVVVWLVAFCAALVARQAVDQESRPRSYTGPEGHTMVVIRGAEFTMGRPKVNAADRRMKPHIASAFHAPMRSRPPKSPTISSRAFWPQVPAIDARWKTATAARFGDPPRIAVFSRTPDSPQVAVSWYDAAQYCNWLSERDGLPKSQWVYPENIDAQQGIELPAGYLHRTGYRLPTEAEWEYAARAGTTTSRHFGDDEGLLNWYAWYDRTTNRERAFPVAQLLPNQWGLFDMLGNVWEWTLDRRQPYPLDGKVTVDVEDSMLQVSNGVARTRRGGSFADQWFTARSAHRGDVTYFPNQTRDNVGFRVARTMP